MVKPLEIPDGMTKYELMKWLFGEGRQVCRGCRHHRRFVINNHYVWKCMVYGATDDEVNWAINTKRCGLFNQPWPEKPVLRLIYEGTFYRKNPMPQDLVKPRFIKMKKEGD